MSHHKRRKNPYNRKFQPRWTDKYLFVPCGRKLMCLVCTVTISIFKDYNLKRHYKTKHSEYEDITGEVREKIIQQRKSFLASQNMFTPDEEEEVEDLTVVVNTR